MFMCLAYFLSIVNNSNNKDLNYYIAKYIIENINHIGSITLQDVADGCFVSVPTVKQFLKKFGYSNYSIFKERLESELDVRKDQIYRGYKIFNKKRLAVAVSHLVDYPLEFNDKMKLKLIIKEIAQSQRVIIVASPTITPILFNFQIDMISMGKTVIMSSLLKDNSIEIEDNDLIILISGTFGQMVLHQYLCDNSLEQHLEKIKKLYKEQAEQMITSIQKYFPAEVKHTIPQGGMFLWVTLPQKLTAVALANEAIKHDIAIAAGDPFYEEERNVSTLRLNYTNCDLKTIDQGIKILGQIIKNLLAS